MTDEQELPLYRVREDLYRDSYSRTITHYCVISGTPDDRFREFTGTKEIEVEVPVPDRDPNTGAFHVRRDQKKYSITFPLPIKLSNEELRKTLALDEAITMPAEVPDPLGRAFDIWDICAESAEIQTKKSFAAQVEAQEKELEELIAKMSVGAIQRPPHDPTLPEKHMNKEGRIIH